MYCIKGEKRRKKRIFFAENLSSKSLSNILLKIVCPK